MSIKQKLRPYQVEVGRAILDSVMGHKGLTFTVEVARRAARTNCPPSLSCCYSPYTWPAEAT